MRRLALPLALIAAIGLGACSQTSQRVGGGAAIGAGVGVVGTALTGGCIPCGAAIGAGAGAVGGYIYDQHKKGRL
ncbi:MAG: hypothetical protein OEQ29_00520 [Alphaproteobacteria bacterium]|nr:hypothetical protein [Alphaproteobacteria bacterium]